MPDGLDRIDERLCNLIERLDKSEIAAQQQRKEFREECWRRFDWLELKLTARDSAEELRQKALNARIASLEAWRGYITGGLAVLVLLWGGLLAWLKVKP